MKKLLTLVLAIAMTMSFTACGGNEETPASSNEAPAEKTFELKLGSQSSTTIPEGQSLQWFADEVKAKTNGNVEITIYPDEQLGDSGTVIDSVKIGTVDLVLDSVANFATYDSLFGVGTVPFLFRDNSVVTEMNQGEIGQKEAASLEENKMHLVNTARNFYRGPYRVLVTKEPINSIDDISGLRFRTYENKNYMKAWTTLGANPIVLAWSETYSALTQGTVDAATSTIGQLASMKFTEVAKYVYNIKEYSSEAILVSNKDLWESLPEEYQTIITECANEMGNKMDEISGEDVQADIDAMKADGAEFYDIDTDPFREKLQDFYKSLEEDGSIPEGTIDIAMEK